MVATSPPSSFLFPQRIGESSAAAVLFPRLLRPGAGRVGGCAPSASELGRPVFVRPEFVDTEVSTRARAGGRAGVRARSRAGRSLLPPLLRFPRHFSGNAVRFAPRFALTRLRLPYSERSES